MEQELDILIKQALYKGFYGGTGILHTGLSTESVSNCETKNVFHGILCFKDKNILKQNKLIIQGVINESGISL